MLFSIHKRATGMKRNRDPIKNLKTEIKALQCAYCIQMAPLKYIISKYIKHNPGNHNHSNITAFCVMLQEARSLSPRVHRRILSASIEKNERKNEMFILLPNTLTFLSLDLKIRWLTTPLLFPMSELGAELQSV